MPGPPSTLPAPELPPESRLALIVGTSSYADGSLRQLRAPGLDAQALADVLGAPGTGGFTVTLVRDRPVQDVRLAISDFLADRGVDDLLVIYLSCHGLVDAHRRLYFAAGDTVKARLAATGLEATWLLEQLDDCRARRQVVILDCCFSGAFANAAKGDSADGDSAKGEGELDLRERFSGHGRGRVVLTASRATEYSFEGEHVGAGEAGSVFTAALVEGLRSGAADADNDGYVSVDEAYDYAYGRVRAAGTGQTPQRWLYGAEGKILLVRSAAGRVVVPAALPETLSAALDSPHPAIRLGTVSVLGEWLAGTDPARALAAHQTLRRVADTDIPRVAAAARELLGEVEAGTRKEARPQDDAGPRGRAEAVVEGGTPPVEDDASPAASPVAPPPGRAPRVSQRAPLGQAPPGQAQSGQAQSGQAQPGEVAAVGRRPWPAGGSVGYWAGRLLLLAALLGSVLVLVSWRHVPGTVAIGANVASSPVLALPALGLLLMSAGLRVFSPGARPAPRALAYAGCAVAGLAPLAVAFIRASYAPGNWPAFASFYGFMMWTSLVCASGLFLACVTWWVAGRRGWRVPAFPRRLAYPGAVIFGVWCALAWFAGAQPAGSAAICEPWYRHGSDICDLSGRATDDGWRATDWLGFAVGALLVAGCLALLCGVVGAGLVGRSARVEAALVRAGMGVVTLCAAVLIDVSLAAIHVAATGESSPDPFAAFVQRLADYTDTDHPAAARLFAIAVPALVLLWSALLMLVPATARATDSPAIDRPGEPERLNA